MPQVKSAGKAQAKASTKITISLPDELLAWAELMAETRRLERNDIIRSALSSGLLLMQMESIRMTQDDRRMADEYGDEVGGVEGFKERIAASIAADLAEAAKRRSGG